ncbi:Glycosyl hydrolase family 26 [Paenibacillus sp. UNC496MF]|uniref:glycosyl hydrolase n=1 Tax=Paenibacillus sp. UNC496MF TaxID=1502753 RepID=UPI0008E47C21|nr:glycosyl hydrolase [Paenibacillus sp. UNC496MF]SFJ53935.1 Glycosyl hydrolase family 26 [Paenibacillus sp. UNC496MF]
MTQALKTPRQAVRKIRKPFAAALVLCMLLYALSFPASADASPPVNPNATDNAKAVLNYLYSVSGNHILSGQHNYTEDPAGWSAQVVSATSKAPAVWGNDFAWEELASARQGMVNEAINQWQQGSIVTISWHQQKPNDPANAGWSSVQGWYTEQEMTELVTPGTTLYNQWLAQVDTIADYLQQLKNAGVPVLWRPYHENNAGWFWWGGRPALFKQLWINMYDRFTNYHHLDNLIWVWSTASNNDWAEPLADYYPGDAFVDVLGQDIYDGFQTSYYNELVSVSNGKPIAITENGGMPDPTALANQPLYTYFLTWGDHFYSENSSAQIQATYNDAHTLTRDEVVIPPAPAAGEVNIDDTATGSGVNKFMYSGSWSTSTGTAKYNGSDHYSATTNDVYQVTFSGTKIKLYGSKDAHHGIAAVSIDGGAETNVDFYAATRADNTLIWTSPTLAAGNHTLKVRVTGTKNAASTWTVVTADRVAVTAATQTTINDATTGTGLNQYEYAGSGWSTSTGSSVKYNGDDHYSGTTNDYYQLRFNGTRIELYGTKDAHHGIAAVSIDGGAETTVDFYAASRIDNTLIWTSQTLAAGNHIVKVRVTGNKNAASIWTVITADRAVVTS